MKFISNFLVFIGFWSLAEEDLIGVNPDANIPDRYLYKAGIILIVFSGIQLLFWILFHNFFGKVPFDYYDTGFNEDFTK